MENEWISVKDKLPERDQRILIIAEGHEADFSKFNGEKFEVIGFSIDGLHLAIGYYREVTHWMPLPEPPKKLS